MHRFHTLAVLLALVALLCAATPALAVEGEPEAISDPVLTPDPVVPVTPAPQEPVDTTGGGDAAVAADQGAETADLSAQELEVEEPAALVAPARSGSLPFTGVAPGRVELVLGVGIASLLVGFGLLLGARRGFAQH